MTLRLATTTAAAAAALAITMLGAGAAHAAPARSLTPPPLPGCSGGVDGIHWCAGPSPKVPADNGFDPGEVSVEQQCPSQFPLLVLGEGDYPEYINGSAGDVTPDVYIAVGNTVTETFDNHGRRPEMGEVALGCAAPGWHR